MASPRDIRNLCNNSWDDEPISIEEASALLDAYHDGGDIYSRAAQGFKDAREHFERRMRSSAVLTMPYGRAMSKAVEGI